MSLEDLVFDVKGIKVAVSTNLCTGPILSLAKVNVGTESGKISYLRYEFEKGIFIEPPSCLHQLGVSIENQEAFREELSKIYTILIQAGYISLGTNTFRP